MVKKINFVEFEGDDDVVRTSVSQTRGTVIPCAHQTGKNEGGMETDDQHNTQMLPARFTPPSNPFMKYIRVTMYTNFLTIIL
jgi:hypothetical protein